MDKFWKQFKSGTDIRGVASEGVAGQKINLFAYGKRTFLKAEPYVFG